MKLSIIVPTYNSQRSIVELVRRIKMVKIAGVQKEIIIVDDASKDATAKLLKNIQGITYIKHKKNTGKGGAVSTGCAAAKGDLFFIQDDDLEYDPLEIPKLIDPIIKHKTSVVFGSRRLNKKNTYSSPLYYYGGVFIDSIISLVMHTRLTDAITGSKAFTREVYNNITPIETRGFEIEAELTAKIIRAGFKPLEIPITYSPRTHQQGKNIRWHHAFRIFKALMKYRFFS